MSWREDQRALASLDGKQFAYEEVRDTGGAAGILHNIITSGEPVYEPIGEGAKIFNVRAKFVGDDYLRDMDDLIKILDKPQTHQFIHPYRGRFTVGLSGKYTLINSRTSGGMCEFTFTLVAVRAQAFPVVRSASFDVSSQVGLLNLALIDSYGRRFRLGAFAGKILGAIALASVAMRAVEGKIQSVMNIGDAFGSSVTGFTNQAGSLLRKPSDMITSMTGNALSIMGAITTAPDQLPSLNSRALSTFTQGMSTIFADPRPDEATIETSESLLEEENAVQWWLANRISFVSAAADTVTKLTFTSSDQVSSFEEQFVAFFDELTFDASLDDQMYSEIRQLKAAVVTYLSQTAKSLPQLTTYNTHLSLPALVIAYQIYGNNDHDLELVDRNDVKHPMFVSPQGLEIVGGT